ncbi:glycoside hydrolase family 130 protein [Cercospora zeae-maydis SCOH1-5]|uniref:Glycoside hydrolase family 130 protein n=1 Tax=Cercospora zeae-maydis SCOH1-5 TaxID=717836 RepID=A0A6A6FS80_9PEZI|nr:glycoside hydrolase family 130 protein [Cercospora zeae-maydis SCOH1-5]
MRPAKFLAHFALLTDEAAYTPPDFPLPQFHKSKDNTVFKPNPQNDRESTHISNPNGIVLNDTIFIFYRGQNAKNESSIGLAWSTCGYSFTRLNKPILYATEPWEAGGGTERANVVRVNGTFYMTYMYTAYDTKTAKLCMATSTDLVKWTKYPPVFPNWLDTRNDVSGEAVPRLNWSKAGAIVNEKISGLYHMYWGDSYIYHATSENMLNWTARPLEDHFAAPLLLWEDRFITPGPAPIKTRDGKWILVYNGETTGHGGYAPFQESAGQMLIDPAASSLSDASDSNPAEGDAPVVRVEKPMLYASTPQELQSGAVPSIVAGGLVQLKGEWFLYYSYGNGEVGAAVAVVQSRGSQK